MEKTTRHDTIVLNTDEMIGLHEQELRAEGYERDLVEKLLRRLAERAGLDFWYIGNIERWGDDRLLRFGKDGIVVYECSAASLTAANVLSLKKAIQ